MVRNLIEGCVPDKALFSFHALSEVLKARSSKNTMNSVKVNFCGESLTGILPKSKNF